MAGPDTTVIMSKTDRLVRIVLPDGIGMIEIQTGLHIGETPRVRVDVTSDQPRYGEAARDGLTYRVTNNPEHDGIVYLDGHEVSRETEPDPEMIEREYAYTHPVGDDDTCTDGCGKHVDHKVNGDPECGPR